MNTSELVERVQRKLAEHAHADNPADVAKLIRDEAGVISDADVLDVLRRIRNDSSGAGKLEQVLATPGVTDVLVNGAREVWFDRGAGLERANIRFDNDAEVRQLATRLAVACGRRLDDAQPFADGRLHRPDASSIRVHALLSPPADGGTCISLRVLRQAATTLDGLVQRNTMSAETARVLSRIVRGRRSFLVVGGTGSGKTTLLGAMLAAVPHSERIICIEDTAELHPPHPHVVNLVARARNVEGHGEITMTDLLRQALRMRPDRIVVGEIRGAEVVDLLSALNTGHDGGAGTVHANNLREIPARMEALAALGGLNRVALHSQLSAAVEVVVSMRRTPNGRQVHQIGVLTGNPVRVYTIWDADHGPKAGFREYLGTLP